MEHRDAQVSDITIVLKPECAETKLEATLAALKQLSMEIDGVDADNGVVDGTISVDKLPHIRSWECVQYVRVEFTYIADYPPGDPRNLDPEEAAEDSED